ncbi:MAG: DUF4301 family protein [Lunatimonas sp.]|uniref:DUF4301 family protein n=1 Tax=Lunatimonas sp. TaxID=2060141 RepID=UPI00263B36AC|nr:DUF4301 family protein [Lunatimonas sp.]MCC5936589.1 DUF4301 family protein [Lunatimonas sp.]
MLTTEQKDQITRQGMNLQLVEEQIQNFKNGFPPLEIQAAASIGDGIQLLDEASLKTCLETYESKSPQKKIVKFVPASGAASRMFKDLFSYLEKGGSDLSNDAFTATFIQKLADFAFYEDLDSSLQTTGDSIAAALEQKNYPLIVAHLLNPEGLDYGSLPKGLLKFHRYPEGSRTPVEEHFVEGASYALGEGNTVRLHFTVSPEHQEKFESHVAKIRPQMEAKFGTTFEISFSQQKKSTDTIAVDMENAPFVEEDGEILFRPAGHGALLENLNDIDADLIFIKNIDNVVPDRIKEPTNTYKKAIGGVLLDAQEAVFAALVALDAGISESSVQQAATVYTEKLGSKLPPNFASLNLTEKATFLRTKLNRPIRVCGMVENTGEPGGGPFWVKESDGSLSLQIGETAQLDLTNPAQKALFQQSSHFNPTDLVCGVKDYKGNKFNLLAFRDPKTGFITEKSKSGRELKAQELPGLWNGSMADWNSLFVEVPLITFNPVKTINDLLRDVHQ